MSLLILVGWLVPSLFPTTPDNIKIRIKILIHVEQALHLMNYHFVLKGDSVWLPPKIYFDSVDGATTRFNE